MNLAALQNQFAKALHYQASGDSCDIVADQFSADDRMQIYRNHFIISLSEILAATYPMLEALIGQECFTQVARQHVLNRPLTAGHVTHYGADFADTLKHFEQVTTQAPYSCEVARFEWEIDLTRQTQRDQQLNTELVPLTQLTDINADQQSDLVFHLPHGCRRFKSRYAVFDLFTALQEQDFKHLDISHAQCGVILVDRNDGVSCHRLDIETFQLLGYLEQKQPLRAIPPSLLTNLNQIMLLDLFAGFSLQKS